MRLRMLIFLEICMFKNYFTKLEWSLLWVLASMEDPRYISVFVCFIAFLLNDLYGFFNWQKMQKRQEKSSI